MVSFYNRKLIAIATASAALLLSCVQANFLGAPVPKWSIQLKDSGKSSGRGLRKGNAIVSHRDGTKIVATTNDGSLHIIQTTNQIKTIGVYDPAAGTTKEYECASAATIVYASDQDGLYSSSFDNDSEDKSSLRKDDFIVYAVTDKNGGKINETRSQVIAVDMDGVLKSTFSCSGKIEGSPVVGKSGIYATCNQNGWAFVAILKISPEDGNFVLASSAGAFAELGPPTLRQPLSWEDEEDLEDVVVMAENWESGFSQTNGGLYMLPSALTSAAPVDEKDQSLREEELSALKSETRLFDYKLSKISSWSYSASAAPLVYGDSIFVGAAAGTLGGFTGNRRNDLSGITTGREDEIFPRWDFQMSPNPLNVSQPIQTQPTMSPDGNYLCVSGVDNDFYCLSSNNGRQLWRNEEGSQFLSRPSVFEGERRTVVYAIQADFGRIHSYDLYNGRRYWDYSCADTTNNLCQDAVEADFAIAPGGNTLYYGDIYGRINSLGVANFETESPTMAPTSTPTISPSANPTFTAVPTQMPQEAQEADLIIIEDIADNVEEEILLGGGGNDGDDSGTVVASAGGNDGDGSGTVVASATADQQSTTGGDNKTTIYIGAAIAALCAIVIPIVLFSMIRKKRKKLSSSKEMVVEIVDDCSSDDLEAQAEEFFHSIETNNAYDPNNGDGIEIEIVNNATPPKGNSTKQKRNGGLPDTPATVNDSLNSMEDIFEISSAMGVLGNPYSFDATDKSVEAVNLRQAFDHASLKNTDDVNDANYLSDDDIPPPPPLGEKTPASPSEDLTWDSLVKAGTSPSSKEADGTSQILLKKPSEKLGIKETAPSISSSQKESSASVSAGSQNEIPVDESPAKKGKLKKMKWRKKNKKSLEPEKESAENDKVETPVVVNQVEEPPAPTNEESNEDSAPEEEQDVTEDNLAEDDDKEIEEPITETQSSTVRPETPVSPSAYSMASDADESQSLAQSIHSASVRSVQSITQNLFGSPHHSSTKSAGSDDDSLYTSHTGYTGLFGGGTPEKKSKTPELSPLASYVYNQDVRRREKEEIVNERKSYLSQPSLSKSNVGFDEEHPDDEIAAAPGSQYLAEETMNRRHGTSARAKRFLAKNSAENESGGTTIAQMYDQLAAIGQQRREEKKPAFRRRNKRIERENPTPPPPPAAQQQGGSTWDSFLNELAEAEKEFFSPSESKSKSFLDNSKTEEVAELPRI